MHQKRSIRYLFVCFLAFGACLYGSDDTPRKALTKAIETGNLSKVQSLIDSFAVGIDDLSEDYDPKSPLIEAASKANIPIVRYLVERGACIEGASEKRYSPLAKFIEAGARVSFQQLIETVRLLIDSGADVNASSGKDDYTPLMAACQHTRCTELIEMLLDMGAFIDARAKDENTPYLLALRNNNLKAYRLLVSRGANTNATWRGLRPLSMLAWEGNIPMAKMLIEETGANINARDVSGMTPLICAAMGGQTAMVQFLAERGADINAKTTGPIDLEVPRNMLDIFKRVVAFPKGCTALNFAKTMGNNAMVNLIADLGGILHHEVEYDVISRW